MYIHRIDEIIVQNIPTLTTKSITRKERDDNNIVGIDASINNTPDEDVEKVQSKRKTRGITMFPEE